MAIVHGLVSKEKKRTEFLPDLLWFTPQPNLLKGVAGVYKIGNPSGKNYKLYTLVFIVCNREQS